MDYFDIDALECHIKKYKKEILSKLEYEKITERNMKNSSDLVCQVLDYSPKTRSFVPNNSKIQLKENNINVLPCLVQKYPSNLSLDLGSKQIDEDEKESLSEKESNDERSNSKSRKVSKSRSNSNNSNTTELFYMKQIIYNLIETAVYKSEKVEINEDEDYEYELLLQKQNEAHRNRAQAHHAHRPNHLRNNKAFASKISTQFNEIIKVRVYLFNTPASVDIDIVPSDTFYTLKNKIITHIINTQEYEILQTSPDVYEIRIVDDDEELPNMDIAAMEDSVNVMQSKNTIFAMIHKTIIKEPERITPQNTNNNVNIKIHFRTHRFTKSSKTFNINSDITLRELVEWIISKDLLSNKNSELYYFVEHCVNEEEEEEDMDNALYIETSLKYLTTLELDLCMKKFPDVPESIKYSQYSQFALVNSHDSNEANFAGSKNFRDENENGKEYFFNDISAGLYQEFEVWKITKYKSKQERILGIDLYNLYNNLPKHKQNIKGILNFFLPKTKNPLKKIKDIKCCDILDNKMFYIIMKEEEGEEKKTIYEVKNNNIRNEIIAKLKFLIKLNQE